MELKNLKNYGIPRTSVREIVPKEAMEEAVYGGLSSQ